MKLTMRLGVRSYDIIIKQGGLSRVGQLINLNRRVLVVSDTGVPEAYLKTVLAQCREGVPVVLPQGEGTKSLECFGQLLTVMLEHGFTRGDAVLALGGGVVGDLAGFAAASYMRGVTFINCPTTTLSQIDSSIGGKTAINLAGTKNTVGAFYQPSLVVADPDTLKSLPERHFINGLAEAVKAGLIADEGLFELFETEDAHEKIEEIVYRSLVMKKNVVERDEREAGLRATLNFGHTLGHAIESANHLGGLYHGECVALGMLPMIDDKALRKRTIALYKKLGLPGSIQYDGDEIFRFATHDKKASGGGEGLIKKLRARQTAMVCLVLFYCVTHYDTFGENASGENDKAVIYPNLFFSPQMHSWSRTAIRDFPRSLRLYSTFGGICGYSLLIISRSDSNSFRFVLRVLSDMFFKYRFSSLNRTTSYSIRQYRMTILYLPDMRDSV